MIKTELISKLKDEFNLNSYESKVWVSLIKQGISSVGELSKLSGVPRNRTYDVLDSLERKGFTIKRMEKPVRYIGVRPLKVIEKIKRDVRDFTKKKFDTISNFSVTEDFQKIEKVYLEGKSERPRQEIYRMISGKRELNKTLTSFLKTIKKELLISMGYRDFRINAENLKRFLEKDKKINIFLFDSPTKVLPKFFGKEVKSTDKKLKFFIKDSSQIIIYISKEKALLIDSFFFVNSFLGLYKNS